MLFSTGTTSSFQPCTIVIGISGALVVLGLDGLTLLLVPDAVEDQAEIRALSQGKSDLFEKACLRVGVDRNVFHFIKANAGLLEAITCGFRWEAGPMRTHRPN